MLDAVDALGRHHSGALSAVEGIGLSGQMHGAVLLDAAGFESLHLPLASSGRTM
jgi:xylulokinase